MAKVFETIDESLRAWIDKQHMFFVSTAPISPDGMVNCSPKGYDSFRILSDRQVAYLDLTGSGVETIAHLQENGRIVFLFCSFDQTPRIVRLHGKGQVYERGTPEFENLVRNFEPRPGMRSIIRVDVTRISDSCGYGVPRYQYLGDRDTLVNYWDNKGEIENQEYRRTRNAKSLDGLEGVRVPSVPAVCE
jgi:hypothetical protein